jgi:hypothetical protein
MRVAIFLHGRERERERDREREKEKNSFHVKGCNRLDKINKNMCLSNKIFVLSYSVQDPQIFVKWQV